MNFLGLWVCGCACVDGTYDLAGLCTRHRLAGNTHWSPDSAVAVCSLVSLSIITRLIQGSVDSRVKVCGHIVGC